MTVTLTQAKAQLRVRHTEHDTYITDLIARAKAWVERYTAQPVAVSTVVDTFTAFDDYLLLSRSPFVSLTSIGYTLLGEAETITVGDVRVQDGRLYPPTTGWPSIDTYSTITVTYTAGHATTPPDLDAAMLLLIEHWYYPDNEAEIDEATGVPVAVVATAGPFRTPTLA